MRKAAEAFRSIGEVSRLVGVPPHVLRYWETQFAQLSPVKRADGRRYYRPEDLHLAAGLCELLREDGMTTRGAARMIAKDKGAALRARGLARLPDRFRGEAEALAAENAGAEHAPSTETMMTEATIAPERTDAAQAQAAAPHPAPEHSAPQDPPSPGGEADAGPAIMAAAETGVVAALNGEASAPEGTAVQAAPVRPAAPPAAESPAPARPATDAPQPRANLEARPAPSAGDLPLFPGLAPAAPPPGVWLPRLADTARSLRAMTPPRRPPAQMQRLRDRVAALIDPEG